MSRPTDLTQEMHDNLVKLISDGMPLSKAAAHEDVHWSTFKRWRTREGEPYETFRASVKRAQAVAQKQMIADIRDGVENWQARAWYLERSDPKNWGRRDRLDTTIRKGEPIKPGEDARTVREKLVAALAEVDKQLAAEQKEMH